MKEYKVRDNEDLFRIATELYGSPSYAFRLASENGIEINSELPKTLQYSDTAKNDVLSPFVIQNSVSNLSQTYVALENQTIFDVMLMSVGEFGSIVGFIRNSTIDSINQEIKNSDRFVYMDTKNKVKTYLKITGRTFSTKTKEQRSQEFDNSFVDIQFS